MKFDPVFLSETKLFDGIDINDIMPMLSCLGSFQKKYKKDEMIILESDKVRSIGIVLSGNVHMVKEDEEGNLSILVNIKQGEVFGESFACTGHFDSCVSFMSASKCTIMFLPFYKIIHTCKMSCGFHHRLIENMMRLIGQKNIQLMEKVEIMSQKKLRDKILTFLRHQSQKEMSSKFTIHLGRVELADYLCADRSALTRELSCMQRDGLIKYEKNTFELL